MKQCYLLRKMIKEGFILVPAWVLCLTNGLKAENCTMTKSNLLVFTFGMDPRVLQNNYNKRLC